MALFGGKYDHYLRPFVLAHLNLFPIEDGWELHVHTDQPSQALVKLQEQKLLVFHVHEPAPLTRAMLWRMHSVFTPCEYVFCRDIDALPMPRDRAACDEFIESSYVAHTIHDSLVHVGIMGGLCGFKCDPFRRVAKLDSLQALYDWAESDSLFQLRWERHGTDQNVLNRLIDRVDGPVLLEHRYNGWHNGPAKFVPRPAGKYRCVAYSIPTPDTGRPLEADYLAGHLGSAGYDIDKALTFWYEHGKADVSAKVKECFS
jgi:hypothetical protein